MSLFVTDSANATIYFERYCRPNAIYKYGHCLHKDGLWLDSNWVESKGVVYCRACGQIFSNGGMLADADDPA